MVVATCGHERGLRAEALGQFETKHVTIESQGALEISHFEMNVANPHASIDG